MKECISDLPCWHKSPPNSTRRMEFFVVLFSIAVFINEARSRPIFTPLSPAASVRDIRETPWNAYLATSTLTSGCSASIIGRRKVLTAARCTCGQTLADLRVATAAATLSLASRDVRVYSISKKAEPDTYSAQKDCNNVAAHYDAISILDTQTDIIFDEMTQPIEIDFRPTYSLSEVNITGFAAATKLHRQLTAFTGDVFACGNSSKLWCLSNVWTPTGASSEFEAGGPLMRCENETEKCRQVGVNITISNSYTFFASTHANEEFIRMHLYEDKYKYIPRLERRTNQGNKSDDDPFSDPKYETAFFVLVFLVFTFSILLLIGFLIYLSWQGA